MRGFGRWRPEYGKDCGIEAAIANQRHYHYDFEQAVIVKFIG